MRVLIQRNDAAAHAKGPPCPADLGCAIEDISERSSKERRQVPGLVATWQLEPSRGFWRVHARQAIQLSVNIHDLVVIVVGAD